MLRTRHREEALLQTCLATRQSFVIDKTNPTREERGRYIGPARAAGFRVIGYYFESRVSDALTRNAQRSPDAQVPEKGIRGTSARLEAPERSEGFDELYYVRIIGSGFDIQEWRDEI